MIKRINYDLKSVFNELQMSKHLRKAENKRNLVLHLCIVSSCVLFDLSTQIIGLPFYNLKALTNGAQDINVV